MRKFIGYKSYEEDEEFWDEENNSPQSYHPITQHSVLGEEPEEKLLFNITIRIGRFVMRWNAWWS